MPEPDDCQLLAQFAREHSETAFAALVRRHVNLVYSAARRHAGNDAAAEEITQAVFIILARKAGSLSPRTVLSGWLWRTARLTAANHQRAEARRLRREQEAYMQSTLNQSDAEVWPHIAPLLDDALDKLGGRDRDAIVLRFFENKNLREVGLALGASEDAAKMRVNRALEKLRKFFSKRGVTLTVALIAGAVSANSVQAAPAGLAGTISAIALAKGAAAGGSTLTLVKGILKVMAWTKVKAVIVVGVAVLLAAGTTTVTVNEIKAHEIKAHRADAWETESFDTNIVSILRATQPLVEILPAKFPGAKGWAYSGGYLDKKFVCVGRTLKQLLPQANTTELPPDRLIYPDDLDTNTYDAIVNLPANSAQALQAKIAEQFNLIQRIEVRTTNVYVLQVVHPGASGLKPHVGHPNQRAWLAADSEFTWDGASSADLARFLEMYLAVPVVDQTGLTNYYDLRLKLGMNEFPANWKDHHLDDFQPELRGQLGLELVPTNMPLEMLVVEKAQ